MNEDWVFANETDSLGVAFDIITSEAISSEPMIYGGSIDYCLNHEDAKLAKSCINYLKGSGALSRDEVMQMASLGYHPVVDTKSVLLQKGQYPCIPGWHCDGVIRPERGKQPDMNSLNEPVIHYALTANDAGDDGTEFLVEQSSIKPYAGDKNVWAYVDSEVNNISSYLAKSGEMVKFTRSSLHRCPAANIRQWRYFFRMSYYHMPVKNELRTQVNIYTDINQGW